MSSRVIRVGTAHKGTVQVITTTSKDGRECVTLETPKPVSETQRVRVLKIREIKS